MARPGSAAAWYRFLDATTLQDATGEVRRHRLALADVYQTVNTAWRAFDRCPDGELESSLSVARAALDESLELLDSVWQRLDLVGRNAS
jgi:hypothetical protein